MTRTGPCGRLGAGAAAGAAVVAGAALAALAERWWSPGAALGAVVMASGALVLETVPCRGARPGKGKPRPDRGNPAGAA